jgi:hypothetical protein
VEEYKTEKKTGTDKMERNITIHIADINMEYKTG